MFKSNSSLNVKERYSGGGRRYLVVSNIEEALRTNLCPSENNTVFSKVVPNQWNFDLQTDCRNEDTKLNLEASSVSMH